MTINILTLFPKIFESVFSESIIKRAQNKNLVSINVIDIRSWGIGKRKVVDDKPYGGGEGMVLMAKPIVKALISLKPKPYTILLSASGKKYDQKKAVSLARKKSIALICGHYEGVDARVEEYVDEILSIGDFVMTGGEIGAMAVIDSVTRLIPQVIKRESTDVESYTSLTINHKSLTLLEFPQYTRPEIFNKHKVPQILLSGNHEEIKKWRKDQSQKRTKKFRPDLLPKINKE